MASASQIPHRKAPIPFPRPSDHRKPRPNLLALWHLLSLDAPTVAALWTWFLARTNHIHLPWTSIAAMATAVWLLYAADRLLDARLLDARLLDADQPNPNILEPRHRFHHLHRLAFLIGILAATLVLAALLPHLSTEAIRLYLIEGSFLIGYFVLIHATRSAHRLPKELAVGLFFAAATFIPAIARAPQLRLPLLPPALLLATLCTLNCLFIYAWEHPASTSQARPLTSSASALEKPLPPLSTETTHPATQLALNHLYALTLILLVTSLSLAFDAHRAARQIPAAIALSTALLLLLHRNRQRLHPTTLRAAADLALLTPILFLLH